MQQLLMTICYFASWLFTKGLLAALPSRLPVQGFVRPRLLAPLPSFPIPSCRLFPLCFLLP